LKTRDDKNLSAITLRRFANEMMAGQATNKAPSLYLAAIVKQAERAADRAVALRALTLRRAPTSKSCFERAAPLNVMMPIWPRMLPRQSPN